MSEINYSTPYCEVIAGGKSIERKVIRAVVQSSRADPSATCEVVLDNRNLDFNGLTKKDDELEINIGYYDIGRWPVFTGTVQDVSAEADYAIYGKDAMLKAHTTRIVKAFEDVTPNDVITYCVNEAGFESSDLGGGDLPQKKHFVLRNTTVTQAIALVERTWGITGWGHYIDPFGVFTWKPWEDSGEIFRFETGKNVIAFEPFGELWRLRTFLMPWVTHSAVVGVEDMRVGYETRSETFRVERMTLNYGTHNFMDLWLRKLSAIENEVKQDVWGAFQDDH